MFIVTVKSIDADSFALPTLYGKTTLQNYNFSMNPQVHKGKFFRLQQAPQGMSSLRGNVRGMGSMGRKPVSSMLCGAVRFLVLSS